MTQTNAKDVRRGTMRLWAGLAGASAIAGTFAEPDWPFALRIASGVALLVGPGAAVLRALQLDETLDAALVAALSFVLSVAIIVLPMRILMETGSVFAFESIALVVIGSTAGALAVDAVRFLFGGLAQARTGGRIGLPIPTQSSTLTVAVVVVIGVVASAVALNSPPSPGGPVLALADPVGASSALSTGDGVGVRVSAGSDSLDHFTLSVTVDSRSVYEAEGRLAADDERLYVVPTAHAGLAAEKVEIRLSAADGVVRTLKLFAD